MKYVGAIRKELGIRTVFNILGPLTNPARPKTMLLGVYDEALLEPLANVLIDLGVTRGMVIYGQDCLDELSMSAPTSVCEFKDGWFKRYTVKPEDFGFTRCQKADIVGGTPAENAKVTRDILSGAQGPKTDIVLLNAGAAIYLGGKAASIAEGIEKARELIKSGAALQKVDEFAKLSQ
jgi:anthranilate phosphoribosyltransferase